MNHEETFKNNYRDRHGKYFRDIDGKIMKEKAITSIFYRGDCGAH